MALAFTPACKAILQPTEPQQHTRTRSQRRNNRIPNPFIKRCFSNSHLNSLRQPIQLRMPMLQRRKTQRPKPRSLLDRKNTGQINSRLGFSINKNLHRYLSLLTRFKRPSMHFKPANLAAHNLICLLYTSPSPRDGLLSRMPSSA